ncbi:MAG: hypothetical protein IPL96_02530 [Holophagaceae bacterium]|nr:hypothetical protein [Holophagaceae bacterium]
MPTALEITLILVLAAIAVGLVPLLFQLRRTAQGLDAFLLSSRIHLGQIAEDVHASRMRMDELAGSLQTSMNELSTFAQAMGDVGRTVKDLHTRFSGSLDATSRNLGLILGGLSAVLAFFKCRQSTPAPEPESQP